MNTIFTTKGEPFSIEYNNTLLTVYEKRVSGQVIYVVAFPQQAPPLFIARALKDTGEKFWTSIPEGRQREAEAIGPLIADFIMKQPFNNVLL